MKNIIEPALDSVLGNIEIALYMATEIEDALADICHKSKNIRYTCSKQYKSHSKH